MYVLLAVLAAAMRVAYRRVIHRSPPAPRTLPANVILFPLDRSLSGAVDGEPREDLPRVVLRFPSHRQVR